RARELGIRLYKVGLVWPLEVEGAKRFAEGLEEVIVVEEKRGFIEDQFLKILYNRADRPIVVGKTNEEGRLLFPSAGELDPAHVAQEIGERLLHRLGENPHLRQRLAWLNDKMGMLAAPSASIMRTPYFCAGCPHNTSTRVPEGSRAMAGIGCHGMVLQIPERRTALITHMGGEGVTWVGQAPFTNEEHVFQNLGDGTYYHSGLLAIRAAAAAKVNITYKILYNDAVAMTGGQPHDGPLTVPEITRQVAAEGAKKVVVVTDEPEKYAGHMGKLAEGVTVRHRDELDAIQRELREIKGLTAIVYDQTCAAEKRRRRKRGLYPDPPRRVFINDRVCEGCGDCSQKSNCVAVKPLETQYGRKRQIDQSDCNKDFSCLKGFCPSFVTVEGGGVRKAVRAKSPGAKNQPDMFANIPAPQIAPLEDVCNILITGIGGTGVITIGALLGMAAHLEGKGCTVLDFTGLAQKNGAVQSHLRISRDPEQLHAVRVGVGDADLVLACDAIVAASPLATTRMQQGKTHAVVNSYLQPTAAFVRDTDLDFRHMGVRRTLKKVLGDGASFVDATGLATALMGDSIATNLFVVGYAWQKGLLPLRLESIHQAIELNGVAIESNKRTFNWGRLAAHDLAAAEAAARAAAPPQAEEPSDLASLVARRMNDLTAYQNAAYAERFRAIVDVAEAAEKKIGKEGFAREVAHGAYKLMAYKDEYEVARLYTDGDFLKKIGAQFEGDYKLSFHLAPPIIAPRHPQTGELQKMKFGSWMFGGFKMLAKLKGLRGTWADVFGYTEERRTERALIGEFEALVRETAAAITPENFAAAIAIAEWPQSVRGYGHVKEKNLVAAREQLPALRAAFRDGGKTAADAQNEPAAKTSVG
ncbi:MAG: indolepyruvate ferredoxin oxidoreductase family protein, partial [Hyphomonadaceae bacterium]